MQLLGTHDVTWESVRRATVELYALSSCGMSLFCQSDYDDPEGQTARIYEQLISEKLLQFAILIRTRFYQGADHRRTAGFMEETGVLLSGVTAKDEADRPYTLKDVCDKIIHATSVYVSFDKEANVSLVDLFGSRLKGNREETWMLSLLLPELCKGVLGWLDATTEA